MKTLLTVPSTEDRKRINDVWRALEDVPSTTVISPQNSMDIWVVKRRI
jgi:hypothetical protein